MSPRSWISRTIKPIPKVFVYPDVHSDKNAYLIMFEKFGKNLQNPFWNILYQGKFYKKDNITMSNYIKDTFYEYDPCITLRYCDPSSHKKKCGGKAQGNQGFIAKGKLRYINTTQHDDGLHFTQTRKHHVTYYIELDDKSKQLPQDIKNITITLKSKLLPPDKYSYGFCHIVTGRYIKCSDLNYIKYGGVSSKIPDVQDDRCRVFPLSKGPIHGFCSFKTGT